MLSIRDLSHVYPRGVRALNGVSLEIPPGMFGLLGPNGAGKSALMRCIATLQTPASGAIAQALIGQPKLLIVDEPTAGLDPEERNRFLNLLADVGENIVVILSTHIVDDVSDLCPRMAIIADGRIVGQGSPADLTNALKGKVWKKTIAKAELEGYRQKYTVISTRLVGGNTVVHIVADSDPGNGFTPVEAGLEDVYFTTLAHARKAA